VDSGYTDDVSRTRQLQLLVEGVIDYAIYMISPEGRVVTWNTGARRLKGYEPAEIIGRPYATFFTPEERARGVPEQALRTAAEVGRFETEGWRVRKDGTRFWALALTLSTTTMAYCSGLPKSPAT
jgi:PAS domain S-box-containing protein